jgi:pimeloyl-ACP methyl ester carboxylesterase
VTRHLARVAAALLAIAAAAAILVVAVPELALRALFVYSRRAAGLELRTFELADGPIAYLEGGGGPCVVLLHGFGGSKETWIGVAAALAPHYRVVAFDNRGCGRSTQPEGPYSMQQLADDAAGVLDHLGITSAHIVGASMGGMISQEFALRYPARVRTLTLMCTSCGGPKSFGYQEMVEASSVFASEEDWAAMQTPERIQEGLLTSFTPEFLAKPNAEFQQTVITTMQFPPTITGLRGQNAAILAHDTYDRLPEIKAPTLVMTGADDGLLDPRNSPLLAERIPGAELRMFEGVRHAFNLEAADEVNATLLAFLGKHSAAKAA